MGWRYGFGLGLVIRVGWLDRLKGLKLLFPVPPFEAIGFGD